METNKLLTLEEIEKIEASIDQYGYTNEEIFSLAATARAYHELMREHEKLQKEFGELDDSYWANAEKNDL